MEILIIILLILLNGAFAMAEIAIVSSRKHRLRKRAQNGDKRAQKALDLASNPNRFLSTVQIGITLVGIFAGAFGGATVAEGLSEQLSNISYIAPYSDMISITLVVLAITYLSLIVGELVPKRIALHNPEKIAVFVSPSIEIVSKLASPLVSFMSMSTEFTLSILGIKDKGEVHIHEEDVRMLIKEGARIGVFEMAEKDIVERTFNLGDRKVNSLMTPEKEIVWIDENHSANEIRKILGNNPHSYYPVFKKTKEEITGIVRTKDILTDFLTDKKIDLGQVLRKPTYVPSNMAVFRVLEIFKKTGIHAALVIGEYGNTQGIVTLTDILEEIVGDISEIDEMDEQEITERDENSWYVDGALSIDEFKAFFELNSLEGEQGGNYNTIAGFVMYKMGKIPLAGDSFDSSGYYFEVADMDGNRVDKILVVKK